MNRLKEDLFLKDPVWAIKKVRLKDLKPNADWEGTTPLKFGGVMLFCNIFMLNECVLFCGNKMLIDE